LTISFSSITPNALEPSETTSGVLPRRATSSTKVSILVETCRLLFDMLTNRIRSTLADLPAFQN